MLELYLIKNPYVFLGVNGSREKTDLSVVGVPFDSTNSFRPGSRFAPATIRLVSQSLETYSFRSGIALEDNPPVDEGDIAVVHGSAELSLRNIAVVSDELFSSGRRVGFLGGEHTITYGIVEGLVKALGRSLCVLVFDAHLDYRSEYLGYKLSHACVTRRVSEVVGTNNVLVAGFRAVDKKEFKEAKTSGLTLINSYEALRSTTRELSLKINDFIKNCENLYISIDMDVIDPAYAPGVATPEPEGITPTTLLDVLTRIPKDKVVGFDIVEVNPLSDYGNVTSFTAAKIAIELFTHLTRQ
ncbi:MAG: agmatinase [Zestosphaera tikiterensis]|uniref:Agmatinase n=1 Tax=Zestosphaera tikiterensis TaxID=1973259 RepID=A0A2R7Y726_9CREN|nr:MAG: agmatinase [Zestosphaera tikiterensis]